MNKQNREQLIKTLLKYADKEGISDTTLAARIGLSMFAIWRWRKKGVVPRSEIIVKRIQEILGESKSKRQSS